MPQALRRASIRRSPAVCRERCCPEKQNGRERFPSVFGDPDENRTRVTAVKGRCLSRLTTGPYGSGKWT